MESRSHRGKIVAATPCSAQAEAPSQCRCRSRGGAAPRSEDHRRHCWQSVGGCECSHLCVLGNKHALSRNEEPVAALGICPVISMTRKCFLMRAKEIIFG
jgi:hypothetical protein